MSRDLPPRQVIYEHPAEIFATDNGGSFFFPLVEPNRRGRFDTRSYDEVRFVFSVWHPSNRRSIDLDRAYAELRASFDPDEQHWVKLAEIEPVVPPYGGETFDGWIVLPILGANTEFALAGSGFEPRARLQIRATAYFVS
ncbi:MAG: hypothetical protein AAGD38_09245 [Acidobacteriota bacterium]